MAHGPKTTTDGPAHCDYFLLQNAFPSPFTRIRRTMTALLVRILRTFSGCTNISPGHSVSILTAFDFLYTSISRRIRSKIQSDVCPRVGWDVRVVIPSSQKSWIGSYPDFGVERPCFNFSPPRQERPISSTTSSVAISTILEILVRCLLLMWMRGKRYSIHNVEPSDGLGEFSDFPRALKEGEIGEWILLDGVSPSILISPAPSKTTDRPRPRALISRSTTYTLARSTLWYVVVCSLFPLCYTQAPHSKSS